MAALPAMPPPTAAPAAEDAVFMWSPLPPSPPRLFHLASQLHPLPTVFPDPSWLCHSFPPWHLPPLRPLSPGAKARASFSGLEGQAVQTHTREQALPALQTLWLCVC